MTIKQSYGSFVKKLPINSKKKNWLMRNWIGGLLGLSTYAGIIFVFFKTVTYSSERVISNPGLVQFIRLPFLALSPGCASLFICFSDIFLFACNVLFYIVLGAFIQSLIRKIRK